MTEASLDLAAPARVQARGRGLAANSALAFAGDASTKIAALASLILAARLLPVREFALLGIALAASTVLTAALDGGVATLVVRDGAAATGARGSLLRASLVVRLPLLALAAAGTVVVGGAVHERPLALLVLAGAAAGAAALSLFSAFRAAQNLAYEAALKLLTALLGPAAVVVLARAEPTARSVLLGLTIGAVSVLPPLALALPRVATRGERRSAWRTAGAALPFGAMALATLAYYRLGTIMLGAWRPPRDVASFTVASALAFGLLALPNAITTGLLPRLAAATDPDDRRAPARAALEWTVRICLATGAAVALAAPRGLELVFGARYRGAVAPLVVLLVSGVLIGASGVLGTVLVAAHRARKVVAQVAASLVAYGAVGTVLVRADGARGAAWTTLATEVLALVLLLRAVERADPELLDGLRVRAFVLAAALVAALAALELPAQRIALAVSAGALAVAADPAWPRALARVGAVRASVVAGVGGLLAFAGFAVATGYGLRVTSDTPTFLALVRDMALRPFARQSPFLGDGSIAASHATPYTQLLAFVWRRWFAPDGAAPAPFALYRFLGVAGLVVTVVFLHAVFVWARRQAGARAAWLTLPVLLLLFGPAYVIWAGDVTFHGFLYAGYFPQNLALALLLYTLVALELPRRPVAVVLGAVGATATMLVHPFTGVLLGVLLCIQGCDRAARRAPVWADGGIALLVGFVVGQVCWPSYSLDEALGETGVPGHVFVAGCALLPVVVRLTPLPRLRLPRVRIRATVPALAALGLAGVVALAAWEVRLFLEPSSDPLIKAHRLSLYWVEDRWRWPLMFAAGAVGIAGLARLTGRGRVVPAVWFAGCMGIGCLGVLGYPVPVWWRFLLFCQVPLALATAVVLAELPRGGSRRAVVATFAFVLVFKLVTLTMLSDRITYFDTRVQDSYRLGRIVPPGPGLVASDPFTSYFIPGTTGHRVLVVTKAHVGSQRELQSAEAGYRLLHRFAVGADWWTAAQEMWRRGVRYVVVEKSTSLEPRTLADFSTGPTPLVRTRRDRQLLGRYYWRLNKVGRIMYDRRPVGDGFRTSTHVRLRPYAVYVLDPAKLFR